MPILTKLIGATIDEILEVTFENMLLELHFNLKKDNNHYTLRFLITDDGETLSYQLIPKWTQLTDFEHKTFLVRKLTLGKDQNGRLLGDTISKIYLGINKTNYESIEALYYAKLLTDKNAFLFFNNGDEGACIFDTISDVLDHSIFKFEWLDMTAG